MIIFYSGTVPYGYLGNTVTSLLRPLFLAALQNDHTFSCKKTSLIRSPINTANFFTPLVIMTVLTGFHCSDIDDDNIMKLHTCNTYMQYMQYYSLGGITLFVLCQKIFGLKFIRFQFIVSVPTTMPAPTTTPEGKN